jgi:hypothetical protein
VVCSPTTEHRGAVSHSALLAFIGLLTSLAVPLPIGASALLTTERSASALPEALLILFGGGATLVTALCAAFRRCAGTLFRGHGLDTFRWLPVWPRVALIFEAGVVPVALRLLRRAVLVIALLRHCLSPSSAWERRRGNAHRGNCSLPSVRKATRQLVTGRK